VDTISTFVTNQDVGATQTQLASACKEVSVCK
jgi:hypothetical protein